MFESMSGGAMNADQPMIPRHPATDSAFRALFDAVPDALVVTDRAGRITHVNQQAAHIFGYTRDEMTGLRVEALVPARFRPGHDRHRAGFYESARVRPMGIGLDLAAVRKDGTEFPVEISLSPLEIGGEMLVIAIARDITERKHAEGERAMLLRREQEARVAAETAERAARRSAERVQVLADASRVFTEARLDLSAVLETVAQRVAAILHDVCMIRLLSDDDQWLEPVALGHPSSTVRDTFLPLFQQRYGADDGLAGEALRRGELVVVPAVDPAAFQAMTPPESWPYLAQAHIESVIVAPLQARGESIGVLTLVRTEGEPYTFADQEFLEALASRAALAIDNARLYRQAQQAVQVREEFLSIAAHELKTPMTTVKGYATLLLDQLHSAEPDAALMDECAVELMGQVDRFENLVDDLLDASRIQRERLDLRPELIDLADLAFRVVGRFRRTINAAPEFRIVFEASQEVEGFWDPDRLDQVLTNLLSNAIKYSPNGGEVRVEVGKEGDQAFLAVSDQGIGMTEEEQAALFAPFVRLDTARGVASGTGLGLYITRQIVTQHSGSISVESEPGVGSRFVVCLPLSAEQDPSIGASRD